MGGIWMESRGGGVLLLLFSLLISLSNFAEAQRVGGNGSSSQDSPNVPLFKIRSIIYSDINTLNQRLFLVLDEGLWQYDLQGEHWTFLDSLNALPKDPEHFQFGYNHDNETLQFWSRGVGLMYEMDTQKKSLQRVDQSFDHQNQFRHFPFYRNGMLYAFGGYGFWRWENIITYYNPEIQEWSLYSVHPESEFPVGRIPRTGTYLPSSDELYIYGGRYGIDGRPDGKNTDKVHSRDIWRFSFQSERWEPVISELENEDMEFYFASEVYNKILRINEKTTSLFDRATGMWYIPMTYTARNGNLIFIQPVQLHPFKVHEPVGLDFGRNPDLLKVAPANFLYNAASKEILIVGVEMLSNIDQHAIRIVRIPSDSLRAQIKPVSFIAGTDWYFLIGGLSVVVAIISYLYWQRDLEVAHSDPELPISAADIREIRWLNREEKELLEFLFEKRRELESQEIEQLLWSDVSNYDYRRKLRNDIIRTINDKFQKRIDKRDFIIRKKDPDDKRRYLYSLNTELVTG